MTILNGVVEERFVVVTLFNWVGKVGRFNFLSFWSTSSEQSLTNSVPFISINTTQSITEFSHQLNSLKRIIEQKKQREKKMITISVGFPSAAFLLVLQVTVFVASAFDPSPLQDFCVAADEPNSAGICSYLFYHTINSILTSISFFFIYKLILVCCFKSE